ncbi:T9SS type A sorting domain-containing protein [Flammeovirga pectinis]|uniref:T9SS type A sorting domain-containing protein n=1 Tax=Flammeovirga pectinis TaxID=2494373 RepID=A0A3S9PBT0_9BACT|nr:T9SS type A sorting domain-containing protein [Flammeovirga pectinis]AZQ65512.1 T9SS type A sorting domain-containing protein [Flammeovirga pectinis]
MKAYFTLLLFFISTYFCLAADITWVGADGVDGDWNTASNWDGGVPNSTDNITIDCNCTINVTADLTINSYLKVKSGTTITMNGNKLLITSEGTEFRNGGVITGIGEFKSDVSNIDIYNFGEISATRIHGGKDQTSIITNWPAGVIKVSGEFHLDGLLRNYGLVEVDTKMKIHGGYVKGGGTIQTETFDMSDEDSRGATLANQVITTSDGCSGSSVTFNGESFEDFNNSLPAGVTVNQDNVYVCGFNNNDVALPIELHSFSVRKNDGQVIIEWVTASEENNSHFIMERSSEGHFWNKIARVEGAGNSNVNLKYSIIDEKPLKGVSYYRLLQVDFDRNFEYFSAVTVTRETTNTLVLKAYPVPADNSIQLHSSEIDFTKNIFQVFSATGHDVTDLVTPSSKENSEITLNISSLKQGVYIFKTRTQMVRFHKM